MLIQNLLINKFKDAKEIKNRTLRIYGNYLDNLQPYKNQKKQNIRTLLYAEMKKRSIFG
jgi:hypothetical protein